MKITPNLSNKVRVLYVLVGLALFSGPFMAGLDGWLRVVVPILGLVTIAGGRHVFVCTNERQNRGTSCCGKRLENHFRPNRV